MWQRNEEEQVVLLGMWRREDEVLPKEGKGDTNNEVLGIESLKFVHVLGLVLTKLVSRMSIHNGDAGVELQSWRVNERIKRGFSSEEREYHPTVGGWGKIRQT